MQSPAECDAAMDDLEQRVEATWPLVPHWVFAHREREHHPIKVDEQDLVMSS
jgi:hypothetical protein